MKYSQKKEILLRDENMELRKKVKELESKTRELEKNEKCVN